MTRVDVCRSDDFETLDRLLTTLLALGGETDPDDDPGRGLGVGLHRFRVGAEELTVFVDAFTADLAGPDPLVQRVLAAMAGG